jgi:hypothetical protein
MKFRLKWLYLLVLLGTMHVWVGSVRAQTNDLVFVYIHGFGGEKDSPQFCENMRAFLSEVKAPARVENFVWDSVEVDILQAGASWIASETSADAEAVPFAKQVIDKYEKAQTPYVIVAFSIGSRVVLRALESRKGKLHFLQAVYFLGSAMPNDTSLPKGVLPAGMKIINYHSPLRDQVHRTAFYFMNDLPAGGQVGYDDTNLFSNYAVSCTHTHKGVGVHIDYSQLAVPIGYIELFRSGYIVPGRLKLNWPSKVGDGDVWWNKVLRVVAMRNGKTFPVLIEQHNMNADYFRALIVDKDGSRKRIARGDNLHAILTSLHVDGQTGLHKF